MKLNALEISKLSYLELQKLIKEKWPQTSFAGRDSSRKPFSTGIDAFDSVFPEGGIQYGQLIEITGGVSSGKTSFLFRILAALTKGNQIAYLDLSGSFFPSAAKSSGIDISRILVLRSDDLRRSLRAAELILRYKLACCIVFDLIGINGTLPFTAIHRLRRETLRTGAFIFFLTEGNSRVIPVSMISLRLKVLRIDRSRLEISVAQSKILKRGHKFELVFR
jgi:hypothetical protein